MACLAEKLECTPEFDMWGFMEMCQENRVDGKAMQRLGELWADWLTILNVRKLVCGKISYLLVWLPESVETCVDETWDKSPTDGYLANSLAQYMCMQTVNSLMPQVENVGCAPAPRPTDSLKEALEEFDLAYRDDIDVLTRRFAVVTFYPFRGGCEICHLQKHCPKGNGESGSTVVLPGYEA